MNHNKVSELPDMLIINKGKDNVKWRAGNSVFIDNVMFQKFSTFLISVNLRTPMIAYGLQIQILDIAYMPLSLLFGMLIVLLPLLIIISNVVTKLLRKLSEAINEVPAGDFEQQVEVMTHMMKSEK